MMQTLPILQRRHVLAGLLFAAIGALGLWVSRNYPVGSALRMGTGYVPRLLCWLLIGLGGLVILQGARGPAPLIAEDDSSLRASLRPLVVVTASLVSFALALEQLGLIVSIAILVGIASLATRELRIRETAATGAVLMLLSWAIFIRGLGLTIPVWPVW
jgi:hypothetical protein